MVMSLVNMWKGDRQGGDAVSINILVLRIGLLFIVKNFKGDTVIVRWGLVRDIIGSVGEDIFMISG